MFSSRRNLILGKLSRLCECAVATAVYIASQKKMYLEILLLNRRKRHVLDHSGDPDLASSTALTRVLQRQPPTHRAVSFGPR